MPNYFRGPLLEDDEDPDDDWGTKTLVLKVCPIDAVHTRRERIRLAAVAFGGKGRDQAASRAWRVPLSVCVCASAARRALVCVGQEGHDPQEAGQVEQLHRRVSDWFFPRRGGHSPARTQPVVAPGDVAAELMRVAMAVAWRCADRPQRRRSPAASGTLATLSACPARARSGTVRKSTWPCRRDADSAQCRALLAPSACQPLSHARSRLAM